ncbi:MAG: OmpH family outer membrane protein [Candidatus Melainabacteria bacterium]|jgi:Skp family chaperone for outer membrane proteins
MKNHKLNIFNFLFSAIILLISSQTTLAAEIPATTNQGIGVVDEERIFNEYSESQKAQKQIASLRSKIQDLLLQLNAEVEKSLQDKSLTDDQKEAKRKEAEQQFVAEKNKAEETADSLRKKIELSVYKAIKEEANMQNLSLILTKESALIGGKEITDDILSKLNK